MASLIDVNVLLAILHARHCHSTSALKWLENQNDPASIVICRVVQMGALRILTRQSMMKEETLSPSQFWLGWDRLMTDDRFVMATEPPRLERTWREITADFSAGQCAETDTYLAGFTQRANLTLITFDRGFAKFRGLSFHLLK